jgi:hypothetical protein
LQYWESFSDNGAEFIDAHLRNYCDDHQITFTRSRPSNKNDGAHVEGKNWTVVRRAVGYHRYDTGVELELFNELYGLLRLMTNFFIPQQHLISKIRNGAKVTKRYDRAQTPYERVLGDGRIDQEIKERLYQQYESLNPAQIRRQMHSLNDQILAITRAKRHKGKEPSGPTMLKRAKIREAT